MPTAYLTFLSWNPIAQRDLAKMAILPVLVAKVLIFNQIVMFRQHFPVMLNKYRKNVPMPTGKPFKNGLNEMYTRVPNNESITSNYASLYQVDITGIYQ